ncbi:MAG TPA: M13 family metallopeptidase [Phycisphaerae bacterium]|nr:M13 family metallopeptidase [Phycisphaerae bacterium]
MRIKSVVAALSLSLTAAITACSTQTRSGFDRATFDTSVKPSDNFFRYVNGNWIRNNPIPAEYSRWGAFGKLRDDNLTILRSLLEDLEKPGARVDANGTKLRDLYKTAMDEAQLERQGATPLNPEFDRIAQIKSRDDVAVEIAHLRAMGIGVVFGFSVGQDEKQSDRYIVHLHQGGLGLPEKDYYLSTTDEMKRTRGQYREHITKMFGLLGDDAATSTANADKVLALETRLAEGSRAPVDLRDEEANYNKKTRPQLAALTPNFQWDPYIRTLNLSGVDEVVVGQPEFFTRFNDLLGSVSPADWQAYFRWHLVHSMAPYLSSNFETENFHFYSETLRGVKVQQPRWKRAIRTIDGEMGEALGKLYVDKYFTPDAKARMDALVKNLLAAYAERIATRDWMGPDTKKQALAKLATINPKIGYPTRWRDYSALDIRTDSYAQNVLRSFAFESQYRLSRLGKPIDRTEWYMTPPTVNAYYSGSLNEIVFPAGILQPPFFDPRADDAINYGGIGAVIGHEITHGFDDQGSRMDAQGNLKNWWTPEDRARFTAKTENLIKQYDACFPVEGAHINGRLTIGENLADLGGVTIAYAAWKKSLNGATPPVIGGFTGEQRFFIGYAQIWRDHVRESDQRVLIRTDPHSPAEFRTLVPLSNFQPFYDAFGIKPGDPMYRAPAERVEVW